MAAVTLSPPCGWTGGCSLVVVALIRRWEWMTRSVAGGGSLATNEALPDVCVAGFVYDVESLFLLVVSRCVS